MTGSSIPARSGWRACCCSSPASTVQGQEEIVIPKVSQETLAEIVGTSRSRVSTFLNNFRKQGLIDYDGDYSGDLLVRSALRANHCKRLTATYWPCVQSGCSSILGKRIELFAKCVLLGTVWMSAPVHNASKKALLKEDRWRRSQQKSRLSERRRYILTQ